MHYDAAQVNNKCFMPFILETSGAILPKNQSLLKEIARIGAERHQMEFSIFFNYSMKRISCLIQKSFCSNNNSRIPSKLYTKKYQ